MPVLNLDEIPRCAGQYFRPVSMHDHIIFDANPPNAFRVHAWFNCNYVAALQMPLLPSRQPGVFMHFEPKPMARAVHKQMAKAVPLQNLSCSCIDIPTGRAVLCRCNGCGLCFQDGLIPGSDASSGPPHKHRAGYITAIVAEYNTQVQHDQLIFPQSFGRWTRVWKGSPFPESDDCFERGARAAELAHLVFNLCRRLQFSNSRLEETDSSLHNLYCKNGRFSHLCDFCPILAHSECLDHARNREPLGSPTRSPSNALQLTHGQLGRIEPHPPEMRILHVLPDRFEQRPFLLPDANSSRLLVSALSQKMLWLDYPGMILGVRKNSSSCDVDEMLVRRNRCPIIGKLPTRGTCVMSRRCVETMIPPMTTVPPSATRTLVSAACVSNAGTPWTRGIPASMDVFSTSTSIKTVPSAVICGVTSNFSTASMYWMEIVLLMVV